MATRVIFIMVQTKANGPWEQVQVRIDLQEFVDAKSPELYLKKKAELSVMGSEIISIDCQYTQEMAKSHLGQD